MPYIGQVPATGENNAFRLLDDIKTYTLTFDASDSAVVSTADDTIGIYGHRFVTGQRVTYNDGGGTAIGNLPNGVYFIIKNDQNTIKLAADAADAAAGTAIDLTAVGSGASHTLNVAFDSVNTKFKATHTNGTKAGVTRAAQLMISVNGVIQEPQDSTTPTAGFGISHDSTIIFSTAPSATDTFFGSIVANNFPTFDISDNTVDNFTGDNSTVDFVLSKIPANNQNVLVTLDGVVQYPSDNTTTRAYNLSENILTFVSAPGNGVEIQVRHIGFAGATSSEVTGFYGRVGNVALKNTDNIVVNNATASGIVSAIGGFNIGIQSGGVGVATTGLKALNFQNNGSIINYNSGTGVVDIEISAGAGGTWRPYTAGIATEKSVGINTTNLDNSDLTGIGNSFQGLYVSNGMIIFDNTLNGNHYIGTNFSGLIAGPANVAGVLTIDGEYVVV